MRINGAESKWVRVTSGVPQGSVLGPVLFLIYINDIDCTVDTIIKKFADDTMLYGRVRTEEQALSIQSSLESVTKWGNEWQMLFNLDECKVFHVGKSNIKYHYSMGGLPQDNVSDEKDHGIRVMEYFKSMKVCNVAAASANVIVLSSFR